MEGCHLVVGPQLQNHAICCWIMGLGSGVASLLPADTMLSFEVAAEIAGRRGQNTVFLVLCGAVSWMSCLVVVQRADGSVAGVGPGTRRYQ